MDIGTNLPALIVIIVTIIISLSVHEAMHAFTGYKLGDDTAHDLGRVSLNPLRHIDPFATVLLPVITLVIFGVPLLAAKPVPFNPMRVKYEEFGAAMVAFAGPLSNLVMAVAGALLLNLLGPGALLSGILQIFVSLNVAIFVFNMIPIPPLDGSRVLYAFAPDSLRGVMEQLESYGIFIVFALVLAVPGFTTLLINLNRSILQFLL